MEGELLSLQEFARIAKNIREENSCLDDDMLLVASHHVLNAIYAKLSDRYFAQCAELKAMRQERDALREQLAKALDGAATLSGWVLEGDGIHELTSTELAELGMLVLPEDGRDALEEDDAT